MTLTQHWQHVAAEIACRDVCATFVAAARQRRDHQHHHHHNKQADTLSWSCSALCLQQVMAVMAISLPVNSTTVMTTGTPPNVCLGVHPAPHPRGGHDGMCHRHDLHRPIPWLTYTLQAVMTVCVFAMHLIDLYTEGSHGDPCHQPDRTSGTGRVGRLLHLHQH